MRSIMKTALILTIGTVLATPVLAAPGGGGGGGCPGSWDSDINSWVPLTDTHNNTCADPEVNMALAGEQHFVSKMKDCGDGTFQFSMHINHGKVYARAQRRIPEGFDGYVAPDDPAYVTKAQLNTWLQDHPVEGKDERPMPAGWYETIWNSNGIINFNGQTEVGQPNNLVFICHFVAQKNPYTGVKEDYLYHLNQHWTFTSPTEIEFQNVNEFITCPGQGGTMTKLCDPNKEDCDA